MLKSFSVTNFKAFEKPIKVDFATTGNYEFNKEALKDGIVKTAVMYGKNAGGKSSLGFAIFDIVATLTDNFIDVKNYINYKNRISDLPFVGFEYRFVFENKEVVYSYKKENLKEIVAERLSIDGNLLVEYDKSTSENFIFIGFEGAENTDVSLERLRFSALRFVKSNVMLADNEENAIFHKFYNFVNKMLLFWSLDTRDFVGYTPVFSVSILREIVERGHFSDLQQFFRDAGFEDELMHQDVNGTEQLLIKYKENKAVEFSLACSSGMNSLLLLYYWLEDVSDEKKCPSFIFIDEFDAFYHYELSYFIIERLKSYNCQVLLTTHNTSLFTNDLLRPDCYYICSKNKIENAHHATPKDLRYGHNLEKLYRGGTFGK